MLNHTFFAKRHPPGPEAVRKVNDITDDWIIDSLRAAGIVGHYPRFKIFDAYNSFLPTVLHIYVPILLFRLPPKSRMCSANLNWCCWRKMRVQRLICCRSCARSMTTWRRSSLASLLARQCAALIASWCPSCSTSESPANSSQTSTSLVRQIQTRRTEYRSDIHFEVTKG